MYDISKDKAIWQEKKRLSSVMSAKLRSLGAQYSSRSARMTHCAQHLVADECVHCGKRRVVKVDFCRDRLCPVCSWRRSRVLGGRISATLAAVGVGRVYRALFLTLTVRNCDWVDLGTALDAISAAWRRMTQLKRFKNMCVGYVKSVEVTRGRDGRAHPHVHVLLVVSPAYFAKSCDLYVSHSEWVDMWQGALGCDYRPSIDVRAIQRIESASAEVTKYVVKAASLFHLDSDSFAAFVCAVKGRRFFSVGGILRHTSADVDVDNLTNADLLSDNNGDGGGAPVCDCCGRVLVRVEYVWCYKHRSYCVAVIGGVSCGCDKHGYKE